VYERFEIGGPESEGSLRHVPALSLMFVLVPLVFNTCLVLYTLQKEFREEAVRFML